jgi:chitodextrinase
MKKRIVLPAVLASLPLLMLAGRHAEAVPDAVTAASLTVAAANVTATSATINYTRDKYDYGTRTLCYDPAPASPANNCTTKTASGNQGSFPITGLTPNTQYNYSIKAVDTKGGERPYTSTGTFKTLVSTALIPSLPNAEAAAKGRRVDALGRGLYGAPANAEGVLFNNRMGRPDYR